MPVYEEELLGGFHSRGDHEFRFPPSRGDVIQTLIDEQYTVFEVLRIEHRTTTIVGIPLERRLLTPVVVVRRKAPANPD